MACEDVLVEKELALEAAFEAQFEYMVHSIDAGSVITPCFAEGLINDHEQDQCFHEHDSLERAKLLLYYVKKSISGEDQRARKNFGLFIDILRGTGHYIQADKLSHCLEFEDPTVLVATKTKTKTEKPEDPKYVCQVAYQRDGRSIKFFFFKNSVKADIEGQCVKFYSFDASAKVKIELSPKKQDEWDVTNSTVTQDEVDQYNGMNSPPYCEMIAKPYPPPECDLHTSVRLSGTLPLKFVEVDREQL